MVQFFYCIWEWQDCSSKIHCQGFIGHYPTKPANMPNHFMNLVIETFGTSEVENGLKERNYKT